MQDLPTGKAKALQAYRLFDLTLPRSPSFRYKARIFLPVNSALLKRYVYVYCPTSQLSFGIGIKRKKYYLLNYGGQFFKNKAPAACRRREWGAACGQKGADGGDKWP